MLDTAAVLAQLAKKSTVIARVGRYAGTAEGQALIDMGGERFPAQFLTGLVPQLNEPVHVWSIDGAMFMVGPTTPKPGVGVIATITGSSAVVTTDFGDFSMPVAPTDPMPSSGDSVGISWSSQPWCTLLVDVPDAPEPPPGPSGGGTSVHSAVFRAIDSGSTDRPPKAARWWTSRPLASASTLGAWFYGSQIKDTIPAGAEFISLEVYVTWAVRRFGPPRWVLHNLQTKTGMPSVSAYTEWDPTRGAGWFSPPDPAGWFNALKAGGAWQGIGFNQGGHEEARNLAEDGMSGALRIKWRA